MAFSRVTKIGDGVSTQYPVNFTLGYIDPTHITARVGNEIDGLGNPVYRAITFLGPNLFQIAGTPAGIGVPIVFERTVPKESLIVDFSNGDVLDEANLDISQLQTIMAVQEVLDGRFASLGRDLDFANFTGINARPPTAPADLANKQYVDDRTGDLVTQVPAILAASAAATAAATAAAASAASINVTAINNSINTKLNANGGTATNLTISGATTIAGSLFNADGSLEVGRQGTGDRVSLVDFHSSGVPGALDYSARAVRNSGANGSFDIINTGTGKINLLPGANAAVQAGLSGQGNVLELPRVSASAGGQLRLEHPTSGSTLSGTNIFIDNAANLVRIGENGGTFRGAFLDLTQCAINGGSAIVHSNNFSAQLAALAHSAVGAYGLFSNSTAPATGANVAGSSLTYAVAGGGTGANPSGTWRNHSGQPGGTQVILCQRVA